MKLNPDNTYIRVEYMVYINKTKKIERKIDYTDYVMRSNWIRRVDDFSVIKKNLQKEFKTTDIIWIEKIEVIWKWWTDWYMIDFENFLHRKWKTIL